MTTLSSPVNIEGFLAVDPQQLTPREDGTAVTRLVIGLRKRVQTGTGADGKPTYRDEDDGWLTAFCQGRLAEEAATRLKKGLLVNVFGIVRTDVFEGKTSLTMNVRTLGLSLFWNDVPTIEPGRSSSRNIPSLDPDPFTTAPADTTPIAPPTTATPSDTSAEFTPGTAPAPEPAPEASTPAPKLSSDNPFA